MRKLLEVVELWVLAEQRLERSGAVGSEARRLILRHHDNRVLRNAPRVERHTRVQSGSNHGCRGSRCHQADNGVRAGEVCRRGSSGAVEDVHRHVKHGARGGRCPRFVVGWQVHIGTFHVDPRREVEEHLLGDDHLRGIRKSQGIFCFQINPTCCRRGLQSLWKQGEDRHYLLIESTGGGDLKRATARDGKFASGRIIGTGKREQEEERGDQHRETRFHGFAL
jgi:hypothetical protein